MSTKANSMSGVWSGEYRYDLGGGTRFTAWFDDYGGALSGTSLEPNGFVSDGPEELAAELNGERTGLQMHWIKIYDAASGAHQTPISYEGEADDAFTRVNGIWRLPGNFHGTFTLTRVSRALVVRVREVMRVA
jgi:hypothetical protein